LKTLIDARFRLEAERHEFRFACDDCAHFDRESAACSLGYPAAPRRDALQVDAGETEVELCKSYELG
jgi:hypothetical protein